MRFLRMGVAALNQTPVDWPGNSRRICGAFDRARAEGIAVLCLPELCLTGYQCEDLFTAPALHRRAARILVEEIAPASAGLVTCVGLPIYHQGAVYNGVALLVNGAITGVSAKQFLAGDGIHYEPRWFKPWPMGQRVDIELHGLTVPFGDLIYDVDGVRFGFEVCEDAWVADRPGTRLAKYGVDVIMNPSASHFAFGKQDVRRRFVLEGSRAFGATYLYANLLGNEAGRAIYDGGTLIAQGGRIVAEGPRFSFQESQLCHATLDVDLSRSQRSRMPSFRPAATLEGGSLVHATHSLPSAEPSLHRTHPSAFEASGHQKEEEFTRAVALGLFDYLRKSRSRGYVISLSGGADSSACAVLVSIMVHLALEELGPVEFAKRLRVSSEQPKEPSAWVRQTLVTLYQATSNSSAVTRAAARTVAEALGSEHHELDVEPIVESYRTLMETALERPLSWDGDDIALQNVQARVRAPSAWMIANLRGMLLCATSNRSEAAVGYTTMDGDTAGGISPIAGIDKAFLSRWLLWMEREGPTGARTDSRNLRR